MPMKPYLKKTLRFMLILQQPTLPRINRHIYNLTDDKTLSFCGMAQTLFIQRKINLFIIPDRLCLSVLIFCTVSTYEIMVKSDIGTPLIVTLPSFEPQTNIYLKMNVFI